MTPGARACKGNGANRWHAMVPPRQFRLLVFKWLVLEGCMLFERYKDIPSIIPDIDRAREMLASDCVATTYRKIPSNESPVTWVVGVNGEGKVCPEEIWTGVPGKPGEGYGGRTLAWKLDTGETFELEGPWHSNPGALVKDTAIDADDVKAWPSITALCFREKNPHGTGQHDRWLKKYVQIDPVPRHDGKQGEEIAMEFLEAHPGVDEICYETFYPFSISSGCRQQLTRRRIDQ